MKPFGFHNVIQIGRARTPEPVDEKSDRSPVAKVAPPGLLKRKRPRRIIAVGGGKGGIGKSMVSTNLGVALARTGRKVVLVDADLGGAPLHTCLGGSQP